MKVVSRFIEKIKDGIHYITGKEDAYCTVCGNLMSVHSRCIRYVRRANGKRDKLSLRVLQCVSCHRFHRELPDFITPYKHLCTEILAAIHDALNNYCVDERTVHRVRHWVEWFLEFSSAFIKGLLIKHPLMLTNYAVNSTFDTLRYFVKVVANDNEWKFNEFA